MNLFKSGTLQWWQASALKISVLYIGIAIGAYWPALFAPYIFWLLVLGIVLGLYVASVWFKK